MSTDLVRRGDVAFVDEDYETAIQVGISQEFPFIFLIDLRCNMLIIIIK